MAEPSAQEDQWRRILLGEIPALNRIKQSPFNRPLCTMCIRALHKHPGGAEIDITVLFADVRGSTALAERAAPVAPVSV